MSCWMRKFLLMWRYDTRIWGVIAALQCRQYSRISCPWFIWLCGLPAEEPSLLTSKSFYISFSGSSDTNHDSLLQNNTCTGPQRLRYIFQVVKTQTTTANCRILVSLIKWRFCHHGRRPKIGITNFGGILHHSVRARKQRTLRILCFVLVLCVEDLPQAGTNTVFNPIPPQQSDVRVDKK